MTSAGIKNFRLKNNFMDTKLAKFQQEILDKMFKMVGFKGFDRKFTKQDDWYTKKQWTEAQSDEFFAYFIEKAQKDLKWSNRTANKEYQYFNLMYGWKKKKKKIS